MKYTVRSGYENEAVRSLSEDYSSKVFDSFDDAKGYILREIKLIEDATIAEATEVMGEGRGGWRWNRGLS